MNPRAPYGVALIVGTVGYVATMALHPTGVAHLSEAGLLHELDVVVAVHVLGLLSLPVVLFGFVGLSIRTGWQRPSTQFAFTAYSLAVVAVMLAAIADGLVGPALLRKTVGAGDAALQAVRIAFDYNFQLNQACAKLFVVGASLAIIAWSYALAALGAYERRIAWFGWFVGLASMAALFSGHVRMTAHGFGAIVLAQALWNIALGVSMLWREPSSTLPRAAVPAR